MANQPLEFKSCASSPGAVCKMNPIGSGAPKREAYSGPLKTAKKK